MNKGIAPFQPDTEVGQFRALAGDTQYVPLVPAEAGYGDYTFWSDDEITAFLASSDSLPWAIYYAYLQAASTAAAQSVTIKDFDLQVDLSKRADGLRAIAALWLSRAQDEDAVAGEDAFEIVSTGRSCSGFIPEGTIPVWGRAYDWRRGQREC